MDIPSFQDQTENAPAESSESSAVEERRHAEVRQARLSRTMEYLMSSLEKADSLEANLGSINSGLIKITHDLEESLGQVMKDGQLTEDRIQEITPALNTYLRFAREVRCFADVELKAGNARKAKSENR